MWHFDVPPVDVSDTFLFLNIKICSSFFWRSWTCGILMFRQQMFPTLLKHVYLFLLRQDCNFSLLQIIHRFKSLEARLEISIFVFFTRFSVTWYDLLCDLLVTVQHYFHRKFLMSTYELLLHFNWLMFYRIHKNKLYSMKYSVFILVTST